MSLTYEQIPMNFYDFILVVELATIKRSLVSTINSINEMKEIIFLWSFSWA